MQEFLGPMDSAKQSLALTARPRIKNKGGIKDWHEIFIEEAMRHAIADIRHCDTPLFIVSNVKYLIPAMAIRAIG